MAKKRPKPKTPDLSYIPEDVRNLAVPIDRLELDPENARRHGEENLASIAASMKRFGFRGVVVVNRATKRIIAGNGRKLAAQRLGWTHLPVLWVDEDPASSLGYAIADNRTAELAEWNEDRLAEALGVIHTNDQELYEALLLDRLGVATAGDDSDGEEEDEIDGQLFEVVVRCKDKSDQKAFCKRMKEESRSFEAVTR